MHCNITKEGILTYYEKANYKQVYPTLSQSLHSSAGCLSLATIATGCLALLGLLMKERKAELYALLG